MLSLRKLAVAAALGVAAVAAGCASSPQAGPAAPSAAAATSETSADSKRPVSREVEGIEPTPTLLQVGGGQIQTIALPTHQIESAPGRIQEPSTRSPAAAGRSIRATDVPGPAGPSRPGSRGIGVPWTPSAGSDPTAATAPSGPVVGEIPDPLAPPILTNSFDSTNFDTSGPLTGFVFIPPDAHAAAGPGHVVSVTNVVLQIHDKTGMTLCAISLADFFTSLSTTTELFDPKILYDQFAERWVVVALEQTTSPDVSQILLAVSDDSAPNDPGMACGTWYQFAIDSSVMIASVDYWADYPGFAVDEEAVYVTGNLFPFGGGAFGGSRLWIIDKVGGGGGGFYGAGTAEVSAPLDPYTCGGCVATTTQPAHVFGTAPTTPNVGTYLVSYSGLTLDCSPPGPLCDGPSQSEFVQIVRVDDPLPLTSSPMFTQEFIEAFNLEDLAFGGALPDAPQMGTGRLIEVNDRRALSAVWRNHKLYMTASINPKAGEPDAGETTAHWWILDTTTPSNGVDPPETLLADQGSIGGEDIAIGTFTFFPSVTVNAADEMTIGYSASDDS
ncbi:MAG: hypothetical protein IH936_12360, partial [Acidobacteria bacterium]|nr:hypothetical protein [Acidobacteriota bacterium]